MRTHGGFTSQNVKIALAITQRTYLIEMGNIRWEGSSTDLARDDDTRRRYLGVRVTSKKGAS